ncbi:hypothetical protein I545_1886 [Mycobacterium kansasii 662]|uniref:Uncharacterized protein n=3 Tax=Mycobacterium kansasii TaxID=1768 RepID=A0A1V3XJA9_MYCKA|nr:hypothetical protein MKAN_07510 [Mycobacterium kansasii ATCC 12478]EUA01545.1 hypothetical protein I547_3677 [Mycobacterium kansasii 824]EUA20364.1 hypothetical protein I545_1886 [Mycobacterium kansasii 662]KEP39941.1 hypothetical protein MKSMC1_49890 [Mycobacterium kansasii]OOK78876.1 hypothetical protein BZL30_2477 [Mycobacterium kansasii]
MAKTAPLSNPDFYLTAVGEAVPARVGLVLVFAVDREGRGIPVRLVQ